MHRFLGTVFIKFNPTIYQYWKIIKLSFAVVEFPSKHINQDYFVPVELANKVFYSDPAFLIPKQRTCPFLVPTFNEHLLFPQYQTWYLIYHVHLPSVDHQNIYITLIGKV